MKFGFVTITVKNMEESIKFYNGILGLEILTRHEIEGGELAFLGKKGEPTIELITAGDVKIEKYEGISIGIEVENLEEASKLLTDNGYKKLRGPISPNGTTKFSFFEDPNGVEIELIEQ